jgi:hypothetical protein
LVERGANVESRLNLGEAADIVLASDDVRHVATVVRLSRRTIRGVRRNALALGGQRREYFSTLAPAIR